MTRWRQYGGGDDPQVPEGDRGFVGVDMRRNAQLLEPGLASEATNKEFTQGVAATRRGIQTVRHAMELGVDFPLNFNQETEILDTITADPYSIVGLNWRIYNGTTFQLRDLDTGLWHSVWIENYLGSGIYRVAIDPDGMDADEYVYAEFDEPNANFRLIQDGLVFQLRCPAEDTYHSVWVEEYHGVFILFVDQVGMAPGDEGAPVTRRNYANAGSTTFRLVDAAAEDPLYHTISIWTGGGGATVAVDQEGYSAGGFSFDKEIGFGEIFGAGVFSDPHGNEMMLFAVRTAVYLVAQHQSPTLINLPVGEIIEEPVRMIQCFDRVLMFRGTDKEPLVWDPALDFQDGVGEWEFISQTANRNTDDDNSYGDGTLQIPNASEAMFFKNRVWVVSGRDEIVVSDIMDYTRFNAATSRFTINSGDNDRIVRLWAWDETTILVFKDQSIWALAGVYGDLSAVNARKLTPTYGLVARDAVAGVGKDVWFLSDHGIYAISQAIDNKLQAVAEPASAPLEPLFRSIKWDRVDAAVMASHANKLYLAVPTGEANYNNTILVFDFLNRAWSGKWEAPDFLDVRHFLTAEYSGQYRLFLVNGASRPYDRAAGAVMMMNTGYEDRLWSDRYEIADMLLTRGYAMGVLDSKDAQTLKVNMASWRPTFSVAVQTDGIAEIKALETLTTRGRTVYYTWSETDYDPSNVNDDHGRPHRQDYSVELDGGNPELYVGSGVNLHLHQRADLRWKIKARGQYAQARIENAQGRCNVHSVEMEAKAGKRGYGVKV